MFTLRYHIKKDGTPGICQAKEGECPLGDSSTHFESSYEANMASQKLMESQFGLGHMGVRAPAIDSSLKGVFHLGECQDYAVAFRYINGGNLVFINDDSLGAGNLAHAMVEIDGEYYDVNGNHGDYEDALDYIQEEFFINDANFYGRARSLKAMRAFYGSDDFSDKDSFVRHLADKEEELTSKGKGNDAKAFRQLISSIK